MLRLPPKDSQRQLLAIESGLGVDGLLALAAALTGPGAELLKQKKRLPGGKIRQPDETLPDPVSASSVRDR